MSSIERKRHVLGGAILLAALVCVPVGALAQPSPAPAVATMTTHGGSVAWSPQVEYDKLVLRISGGDYTASLEFEGAATPYFIPVDAEGYALPDGTYHWELRVIPRPLGLNQKQFRSDEHSPDGRSTRRATMPEGLVQSGAFTIVGGSIADPGLEELRSEAPASTGAEGVDIDDSDGASN